MRTPRPIAFYAPLKSPNHPSPSGDRTMARLLMKALEKAGFRPELASELRTFEKDGDRRRQEDLRRESLKEADHLIASYQSLPAQHRPSLWFTYHVYYKAPDWIGPRVSEALRIPYVIAEGSRASKRAEGPWALAHEGAEAALDRADTILVMTSQDREALERAKPPRQLLIDFPPFLNADEWPEHGMVTRETKPSRLLTVAMMREGDKLASYRILATACERLRSHNWTLDIVGEGEARGEIERLFARFSPRIRFHGQVEDKAVLASLYGSADLFVWPAVNEAYGMVLLEAQLFGCPVITGSYGGVASVLKPNETGLLVPPGDAVAFAGAVEKALAGSEKLHRMSSAARRFVRGERTLDHAASRLHDALLPLTSTAGERACAF